MRVAIYYTPAEDHPLTCAAAQWFGRSPFAAATPAASASLTGPVCRLDMRALTAEPRRYGFHATLKAPFRLALDYSLAALEIALSDFCGRNGACTLSGLQIQSIDSFFALTLRQADTRVNAL